MVAKVGRYSNQSSISNPNIHILKVSINEIKEKVFHNLKINQYSYSQTKESHVFPNHALYMLSANSKSLAQYKENI